MNEIFWNTIENFKEKEFECKCGCGFNKIDKDFVILLDFIRDEIKEPLIINSACRCISHNQNIGGSPTSSHLHGLAVDLKIENSNKRYKVLNLLLGMNFKRIGIYDDFIHIDINFDKSKPQNVIWYK